MIICFISGFFIGFIMSPLTMLSKVHLMCPGFCNDFLEKNLICLRYHIVVSGKLEN